MKSRSLFDLGVKERKLKELLEIRLEEKFWGQPKNAESVNKQITKFESDFKELASIEGKLENISALMELVKDYEDKSLENELKAEIASYEEEINNLEIKSLFKEKEDINNAIITFHPGAGGTEAQDWVEMLYRMYQRWAEKKGYKTNILDYLPGDEAGIKSISIEVIGDYAYGFLKSERGVHRLIRISPFDTNKKRHTTFASVEVLPEIEDDDEVEIADEDVKIDTYRASGAGGQHVNKKDSAVRITHIPTGIVVQCQSERSQLTNKNAAFKILKSKLLELNREKEENSLKNIRNDQKEIAWGSQIRSYVFQPYQLVKDHRTNLEYGDVNRVLDGDLDQFIKAYLYKGG